MKKKDIQDAFNNYTKDINISRELTKKTLSKIHQKKFPVFLKICACIVLVLGITFVYAKYNTPQIILAPDFYPTPEPVEQTPAQPAKSNTKNAGNSPKPQNKIKEPVITPLFETTLGTDNLIEPEVTTAPIPEIPETFNNSISKVSNTITSQTVKPEDAEDEDEKKDEEEKDKATENIEQPPIPNESPLP